MKPPALTNVQILRGIAALLVVLYHIPDELSDHGWDTSGLPVMWLGASGVDIFFVISGFIMVYSTVGLFGRRGAPAEFFLRRLARIVPLYWLFTTLAVVLTIRAERHAASPGYSVAHFAASYLFTFFPQPGSDDLPIYRPGWSLNFEMFFYVCFAAALLMRSRPRALVALSTFLLLLVGLGGAAQLGLVHLHWPIQHLADSDLLEFVFGMALAQVYLKGYRVPRWAAIGAALAALTAIVLATNRVSGDWFPYRGFVWGPAAAMLVAAAVLHEPPPEGTVRRAFERLGDASYSLYLVHTAVFMGLFAGLARLGDPHRMPTVWLGLLMLVAAIVAALLLYRYIERPVTRALQARLRRGAGPSVPRPSTRADTVSGPGAVRSLRARP